MSLSLRARSAAPALAVLLAAAHVVACSSDGVTPACRDAGTSCFVGVSDVDGQIADRALHEPRDGGSEASATGATGGDANELSDVGFAEAESTADALP